MTDKSYSKRAYQVQFKRWNFPSKQSAAFKDQQLIARINELWQQNFTQAEMLQTLLTEGHHLGDKELARVRKKNGMIMRASSKEHIIPAKRKGSDFDEPFKQITEAANANNGPREAIAIAAGSTPLEVLPPEVVEQRQRHRDALKAESEERYQNKTRRRRTRPWAGLPADPPGPPRFPSETTIDEAKQLLGIDHNAYLQIRKDCERVCVEEGVRRKVEAGAEKWRHVLERTINENLHLHPIFHDPHVTEHRDHLLSVEVIANDVTKRMRTQDNKMTIQECKNILQINPEEARQLRKSFEDILRADSFTNKHEAGAEHWTELKGRWISSSPHLTHLAAAGATETDTDMRNKAMELLCRDVMKRYRDEKKRQTAAEKDAPTKWNSKGATKLASRALAATSDSGSLPFPSPAPTAFLPPTESPSLQPTSTAPLNAIPDHLQAPMPPPFDYSNLQIDPELLLAANDSTRLRANGGSWDENGETLVISCNLSLNVYIRRIMFAISHRELEAKGLLVKIPAFGHVFPAHRHSQIFCSRCLNSHFQCEFRKFNRRLKHRKPIIS